MRTLSLRKKAKQDATVKKEAINREEEKKRAEMSLDRERVWAGMCRAGERRGGDVTGRGRQAGTGEAGMAGSKGSAK